MPTASEGATESGDKPRRTRNNQKYIRNLYGSPASLTLQSKRRIELRPRGQRGDLSPVTKEELTDAKLVLNVGVLVEIVSAPEALKILEAQTINQQSFHPAMNALRNHHGEEYDQTTVVIDESMADKGVTVATLEDGNVVIQRGPGGGIQREPSRKIGPLVANVPGSDPEMAKLLAGDDAAKSGSSLEDVLGGYLVER